MGGVMGNIRAANKSTQNNLRYGPLRSPSFAEQAALPPSGVPVADTMQQPLFDAGLPRPTANLVGGLSPAVQTAGNLARMAQMAQVGVFQAGLTDAGVNLNPVGQAPGDFQRNVAASQTLFNQTFGGRPRTSGPVTAYAPTGLRQRTLDADGGLVFGQGNVMAGLDGTNAAGGNRFFLGQVQPVSANGQTPAPPPSPIEPEPMRSVSSQMPGGMMTPFQQAEAEYRAALQEKPKQALEPGYEPDPTKPGAVRPIAGSKAEGEAAKVKAENESQAKIAAEKTRQTIANTTNVLDVISRVKPLINSKTTGWGSLAKDIPGTDAKRVAADIETINSNLGVDRMLELRAAAMNGSSGLGPLTEREFTRLVASKRNLDQAQDAETILENINAIEDSYRKLNLLAQGINPDTTQPSNAGAAKPSGPKKVGRFEVTEEP
jgi:hypothetical protein